MKVGKKSEEVDSIQLNLVNVVGDKDGDQILPIFYSDNYISLLGGEQRQISFRFKDEDTRGNKPQVVVTGYNVQ